MEQVDLEKAEKNKLKNEAKRLEKLQKLALKQEKLKDAPAPVSSTNYRKRRRNHLLSRKSL